MEKTEVRFEEGTLRQTYSGTAWKRTMSKYLVEFEVNGKRYSAWVNPHDGGYYSDCRNPQREGLCEFVAELEQIIRQPKPHLDSLTVRKFLCEHLRAMMLFDHAAKGAAGEVRMLWMFGIKIGEHIVPLEDLHFAAVRARYVGHFHRAKLEIARDLATRQHKRRADLQDLGELYSARPVVSLSLRIAGRVRLPLCQIVGYQILSCDLR